MLPIGDAPLIAEDVEHAMRSAGAGTAPPGARNGGPHPAASPALVAIAAMLDAWSEVVASGCNNPDAVVPEAVGTAALLRAIAAEEAHRREVDAWRRQRESAGARRP